MRVPALVLLLGLLAATSVAAFDGPVVECGLSADRSSLVVTASNTGGSAYACAAACRFKLTGERPLNTFNCSFTLGANAAMSTVCNLAGKAPDHFAELLPTRSQCQPR